MSQECPGELDVVLVPGQICPCHLLTRRMASDLRLGLPSAGFWTVNNNSASLLLRTYCVSVF